MWLCPRPHWGSSQRSPRPPSWIWGVLILREEKGRKGEREKERERKSNGRKEKGKGRGNWKERGRSTPAWAKILATTLLAWDMHQLSNHLINFAWDWIKYWMPVKTVILTACFNCIITWQAQFYTVTTNKPLYAEYLTYRYIHNSVGHQTLPSMNNK